MISEMPNQAQKLDLCPDIGHDPAKGSIWALSPTACWAEDFRIWGPVGAGQGPVGAGGF